MTSDSRGYTLVELLVTMSVFIIVIMIASDSFNTILTHSAKLFKSEESNIEGVIGLEIMRHDIQQAGFGLFTEPMPAGMNDYDEAVAAPASTYNDAPNNVPRPILAGNNVAAATESSESGNIVNLLAESDYLVIKATSVGRSGASQKWSYLRYAPGNAYPHTWPSAAQNLASGDKVLLLRRQLAAATNSVTLEPGTTFTDGKKDFYISYSDVAFAQMTSSSSGIYSIYGVDDGDTLRIPFNRTDYFVARPQDAAKVPPVCAPNTGILYKTTVNNDNSASKAGKLTYIPILDCVANMQVVFGWDLDGDGAVETYSNADGTTTIPADGGAVTTARGNAANNTSSTKPNIRNSLKMIKVYVLAQEGRKDPSYVSPSPIVVGDGTESSLTRSYDINAAGWRNYRWKVYRIVARPKNLAANQ